MAGFWVAPVSMGAGVVGAPGWGSAAGPVGAKVGAARTGPWPASAVLAVAEQAREAMAASQGRRPLAMEKLAVVVAADKRAREEDLAAAPWMVKAVRAQGGVAVSSA